MPSLNFTSENGRPIAFIKAATKEFDKSIIYLHEENQGPQEINIPEFTYFPLLGKVKDEVQNHRIAVIGKSGSGKSYFVGQMLDVMKSKKLGDKEREIVIYSGVLEDPPLDKPRGKKGQKEPPMRINLDSSSELSLDINDLENCIVVFDDIEKLASKEANQRVLELRDILLEKGRHHNIDIISISHNPFGGKTTRMVHTESSGIVLFPSKSTHKHIADYLSKYIGFSRDNIQKIKDLGEHSRWVYISNTAPTYVVHEHGVLLMK